MQGVCFRDFTRRQAASAGVSGWVRNLEDGNVEAVFEGEESDVEKAVAAIHRGPSFALVSNVVLKREAFTGEFSSFEILSD